MLKRSARADQAPPAGPVACVNPFLRPEKKQNASRNGRFAPPGRSDRVADQGRARKQPVNITGSTSLPDARPWTGPHLAFGLPQDSEEVWHDIDGKR